MPQYPYTQLSPLDPSGGSTQLDLANALTRDQMAALRSGKKGMSALWDQTKKAIKKGDANALISIYREASGRLDGSVTSTDAGYQQWLAQQQADAAAADKTPLAPTTPSSSVLQNLLRYGGAAAAVFGTYAAAPIIVIPGAVALVASFFIPPAVKKA